MARCSPMVGLVMVGDLLGPLPVHRVGRQVVAHVDWLVILGLLIGLRGKATVEAVHEGVDQTLEETGRYGLYCAATVLFVCCIIDAARGGEKIATRWLDFISIFFRGDGHCGGHFMIIASAAQDQQEAN